MLAGVVLAIGVGILMDDYAKAVNKELKEEIRRLRNSNKTKISRSRTRSSAAGGNVSIPSQGILIKGERHES
jgi:hypothetical protein